MLSFCKLHNEIIAKKRGSREGDWRGEKHKARGEGKEWGGETERGPRHKLPVGKP
jgi:hypothetical protein